MGHSVLVFVSHASEDKETYVRPIVKDLSKCYIKTWYDEDEIMPGDNLRKSIFKDGLDKADVALIFFTRNSLKSRWVDREIKHVLREELKDGNDFDLSKIISVFDSQETYDEISDKYPELTDDLLHLMPQEYSKIELGQLISAIWSKYLSLRGEDVETQRKLLASERKIFQRDKEIQELKDKLKNVNSNIDSQSLEFEKFFKTQKLNDFINKKDHLLQQIGLPEGQLDNLSDLISMGLIRKSSNSKYYLNNPLGKDFFKWYILNYESKLNE